MKENNKHIYVHFLIFLATLIREKYNMLNSTKNISIEFFNVNFIIEIIVYSNHMMNPIIVNFVLMNIIFCFSCGFVILIMNNIVKRNCGMLILEYHRHSLLYRIVFIFSNGTILTMY